MNWALAIGGVQGAQRYYGSPYMEMVRRRKQTHQNTRTRTEFFGDPEIKAEPCSNPHVTVMLRPLEQVMYSENFLAIFEIETG
jgi:hypothetical protein